MQIIKQHNIVEDHWQVLGMEEPLPAGDIIVPVARWFEEREALLNRKGGLGIQINGDDKLEDIIDDLSHLDIIALEFPKYNDGRCYSFARLLRERYQYSGELRAVGDVLRDQINFMARCGIDSFVMRADQDLQASLSAFEDFSVKYQSAADKDEPIYRYRTKRAYSAPQ
jgi:uncharacterized protein (DUF934 family)